MASDSDKVGIMTSDTAAVLHDIRVLDVSEEVAGPFCAKLLAGLGAEVIKVEKPGGGDASRRLGPFPHDAPHAEQSAAYLYLNTGKKSVTLDLEHPTGVALLRRLAQQSDILIESFVPGHLDELDLGYSDLERLHPGLIYTSVTPFGQTGPYRDYKGSDLIVQALGAVMHPVGIPEREPLKIGGQAALYTTGISAFAATMLALHVRETAGHGQHVDVSAMETLTVAQIHASIQHQFGRPAERRRSTLVQAQDGWVHPGLERGVDEKTWPRVCELMGKPELATDPKFNTSDARRTNQTELSALIEAWTATQPKEAIYHALQGLRTVAGYVATVEDLMKSEQFIARGYFQRLDHPEVGEAAYPGAAMSIEGTPWRHARAPLLGEHNAEVYGDRLGHSPGDLAQLRGSGAI